MFSISRKQILEAERTSDARRAAVSEAWEACTLTASTLLGKPSTLLGGAALGFSAGWLSRPKPCPVCTNPDAGRISADTQSGPVRPASAFHRVRRNGMGLLSATLKGLAILRALQSLLPPK